MMSTFTSLLIFGLLFVAVVPTKGASTIYFNLSNNTVDDANIKAALGHLNIQFIEETSYEFQKYPLSSYDTVIVSMTEGSFDANAGQALTNAMLFGTKVLFFGGSKQSADALRPLIYGKYVGSWVSASDVQISEVHVKQLNPIAVGLNAMISLANSEYSYAASDVGARIAYVNSDKIPVLLTKQYDEAFLVFSPIPASSWGADLDVILKNSFELKPEEAAPVRSSTVVLLCSDKYGDIATNGVTPLDYYNLVDLVEEVTGESVDVYLGAANGFRIEDLEYYSSYSTIVISGDGGSLTDIDMLLQKIESGSKLVIVGGSSSSTYWSTPLKPFISVSASSWSTQSPVQLYKPESFYFGLNADLPVSFPGGNLTMANTVSDGDALVALVDKNGRPILSGKTLGQGSVLYFAPAAQTLIPKFDDNNRIIFKNIFDFVSAESSLPDILLYTAAPTNVERNYFDGLKGILSSLGVEYVTYVSKNARFYDLKFLDHYSTVIFSNNGYSTSDGDVTAMLDLLHNGTRIIYLGGSNDNYVKNMNRLFPVNFSATTWTKTSSLTKFPGSMSSLAVGLPLNFPLMGAPKHNLRLTGETVDVALVSPEGYPALYSKTFGSGVFVGISPSQLPVNETSITMIKNALNLQPSPLEPASSLIVMSSPSAVYEYTSWFSQLDPYGPFDLLIGTDQIPVGKYDTVVVNNDDGAVNFDSLTDAMLLGGRVLFFGGRASSQSVSSFGQFFPLSFTSYSWTLPNNPQFRVPTKNELNKRLPSAYNFASPDTGKYTLRIGVNKTTEDTIVAAVNGDGYPTLLSTRVADKGSLTLFQNRQRDSVWPEVDLEFRRRVIDNMFNFNDTSRTKVVQHCSGRQVDLMFVLDGSGSITAQDFLQMKFWSKRILSLLDLGPDGVKVGIAQFSDKSRIDLPLTADLPELFNGISAIKQISGGTAIELGLQAADEELTKNGRADATQVLVLLTDGENSGNKDAPVSTANQLKAKGVEIFTISAGSQTDPAVLSAMASPPAEEHFFQIDTIAELNLLVGNISKGVCVECWDALHVALVIDGSGSISSGDFEKVRSFSKSIVSSYDLDGNTEIGVIQFSNRAEVVSDLSDDEVLLNDRIDRMEQFRSGTRIDIGLQYAGTLLNGTVAPVVILMTDGKSDTPAKDQADALKAAGVTIIAVGVGSGIDMKELQGIVSEPVDQNLVSISDFANLNDIVKELVKRSCADAPVHRK
eukprot:TRINITY_DN99_c0_g2_i1.p1 TRINITY_DN99_c0_g2~~TRINITY_DN99_c0_g2_i1.p1  ORF type:complete len:1219 (+),score=314.40 TRINITY_DN99_c0_g2_i1:17-3673(+)